MRRNTLRYCALRGQHRYPRPRSARAGAPARARARATRAAEAGAPTRRSTARSDLARRRLKDYSPVRNIGYRRSLEERSISISKTRLSKHAQLRRAGKASAWVCSLACCGALSTGLGTIAARNVAWGASTPWKRIRCGRGWGTSAASRCRNSSRTGDKSGDITMMAARCRANGTFLFTATYPFAQPQQTAKMHLYLVESFYEFSQ